MIRPFIKSIIEPSEIMTVQAQFDNLIHGVVTMINDTLAPVGGTTGPYGLNGEQGHEIFPDNTLMIEM